MTKRKKHVCSLGLGSESMLPTIPGKSKFVQALKKLTFIAVSNPASLQNFLSYPAILAERQRQLVEGGKYVIHPFSLFSLIWKSFMIIINVSHMTMGPLRLCLILEKTPQPRLNLLDCLLLAPHAICFLDIIVRFNVGYVDGLPTNIVMVRKRIAGRYLCCWFFVDILSCLPLAFILLCFHCEREYVFVAHLLPLLRCFRLFTVICSLRNFLRIFTRSYIWHRAIRHVVLFIVTMHWCSCLVYLAPVMSYYRDGSINPQYCSFFIEDATKYSVWERYEKSTFIAYSSFFGTGYSMMQSKVADEIAINSIVILYTSMFMVYTLAHLMKIYITKYNSIMRYHELMNQVEKYMRHKQFPTQLKKRVRDYYNYRYQKRYFKEETALDCLSGKHDFLRADIIVTSYIDQLLNEINLHTCHNLVNKVALFEGLPASVIGTILGCLRPEVFMSHDLMIRAGDIGDCMYFIANGTVAVYSLKGVEVCHLEDGAHFGEVALLMKDSKRVATVIAVEITQVYRLDAADFQEFIMTNQELYQRVEVLASKRMHETVLIDESFRRTRSNTV